jgi:small GTP-binding protein
MAKATSNGWNEASFFENVETQFEEKAQDFSKTLNIAFIGKVSSGKSSLINAFLQRNRKNAVAKVGAEAGVTTNLKILRLDERTRLIDSPGLDDVKKENSEITRQFLKHIDVGILVVTGAADASQKKYLDDLREHCDSIFVVLNKIDDYDRFARSNGDNPALEKVIAQWKQDLQIQKIYPVCAFGYDQDLPPDIPLDIRGVYGLRKDVIHFLCSKGKDLLLARHMGEKKSHATKIITVALFTVVSQTFIPGSAVYITATQAAAIASLYYLYTGEILSSKAALAILPTFAAEAAGTSLYLFVASFLPPTGVVNVAAVGIAVSITLAMLATVNSLLASGAKLEEKELLKSKFRKYRKQAKTALKDIALTDVSNVASVSAIIQQFV